MASPAPPTNVVPTVDANDQITLTWDHDPTWFAFDGNDSTLGGFDDGRWYSSDAIDHFEIQLTRDANGWTDPSGGPSSVTHDGSTSYSVTYNPNSDNSYNSQVGIDSEFRFHVRAVNADGASSWSASNLVYTDAIPPHNPSVSRPDANTFDITFTVTSNIANQAEIFYREDTGSGYGAWTKHTTIDGSETETNVDIATGNTVTATFNTTDHIYQEDSRYQFRLTLQKYQWTQSEYVYADYGNNGNVYFEDDFESNDLSAWRNTPGAYVDSGSGMDSGFSKADQGTYYCVLDGDSKIDVSVGDLSNESDVIVKAAVAVGSADSSGEELAVDFYDGSNWQQLTDFHWEYNKQGWVELTALVPSSYLSSNAYIRFESESGGGGDHYYIDRVVVSDILHEYTKPAAPSGLSLDTSVEDEITSSWTENATFDDVENGGKAHAHYTIELHLDGSEIRDDWPTLPTTSYTHSSLNDGEEYEVRLHTFYEQMRNGSENSTWTSSEINVFGTTILPSPSGTSISPASSTSLDVSWTDNADNEDGTEVYYRQTGASSWVLWSDLGANTTSDTVTGLSQDTEYETYVNTYTEHTSSDSGTDSGKTFLNESRATNSYLAISDSYSIRVIDFLESVSSHSATKSSSSLRIVDLLEGVGSHSTSGSAVAARQVSLLEGVTSHSNPTSSSSIGVIDVGYGVESHSKVGSSSADRLADLVAAVQSHSDFSGSEVIRVVDLLERVTSASSPIDSSVIRVVDILEGVTSHSNLSDSSVISVIDVGEPVESHSTTVSTGNARDGIGFEGRKSDPSFSATDGSGAIRVVDLLESVGSHSSTGAVGSSRGSLNYEGRESDNSFSSQLGASSLRIVDLLESVSSHTEQSRSFVMNERTSLELVDHNVHWNDDKSFWYTDWFQEQKVFDKEDTMAIRSLVVENAPRPVAIVTLQYDSDGNGNVDVESNKVELDDGQQVYEVTGVPVDEDGYYRIKVSEYSGYNSVYSIDTAIIN